MSTGADLGLVEMSDGRVGFAEVVVPFARDVPRVESRAVRMRRPAAGAGSRTARTAADALRRSAGNQKRKRDRLAAEEARAEAIHAAHARVQHERARRRRDDMNLGGDREHARLLDDARADSTRRSFAASASCRVAIAGRCSSSPSGRGPRARPCSARRSAGSSIKGSICRACLCFSGSRGAAAAALRLDYHVDDNPRTASTSSPTRKPRPILLVAEHRHVVDRQCPQARHRHRPRVGTAVDILEQATEARENPGLLKRFATMVGWK